MLAELQDACDQVAADVDRSYLANISRGRVPTDEEVRVRRLVEQVGDLVHALENGKLAPDRLSTRNS